MDDDNRCNDENVKYDAALGDSAADPVGPAGAGPGSDPVSSELSALFAAVLVDEPPSSVTVESVLREARSSHSRREKRSANENHSTRGGFARWFDPGSSSFKWGGGLVAAAALVAAVVVIGPTLGSQGAADSASTAGAQVRVLDGPGADSSSESSAASSKQLDGPLGESGADAGGDASVRAYDTDGGAAPSDAASAEAAPMSAAAEASQPSGSSEQSEAASGATTSADSSGRAVGTTSAGVPPGAGDQRGSELAPCPQLQPLTGDEVVAVQRVFPQGRVIGTRATESCLLHPLRGSMVDTPWTGVQISVIIYDWSRGAPSLPPSAARGISGSGSRTVAAWELGSGDTRYLTADQLQAIADAVAGATG